MIYEKKGKIYLIILSFIMISLFNNALAKYDKIFYDFTINSINGDLIKFSKYKNKPILMVNVASNCGFTKQYTQLQELWNLYKDKGLIVLGVPTNQFGGQEPGTNNEIKKFCEVNFNINFPLTTKVEVKGENAHPIYVWAKINYGKSTVPKWNFHKILINKDGKVYNTYASFTNPMSKKIIKDIDSILK
tara:strand:- start:2290 stop:2856 length:567 start_codon:yes stop_codon:yes gene_type:complete